MRQFVDLPPEEQIIPFEALRLQVAGKELVIGTRYAEGMRAKQAEFRLSSGEWDAAHQSIRELLPFTCPIRFTHPTLGTVTKARLRRWLNKNLRARWHFSAEHVLFESDFDATHYKIMWV